MLSNSALALAFLPLTFAHFQLNFPEARGFTDDTEGNFPCGGYNDVQQERTDFPISGGPIQLHMEHPQTNVAVYMAIGDNPGEGFSIVAQQQTQVSGLGDFCFGHVSLPEGLNVTDGTKASIQVVTNNHEAGGLYQCADVTLVNNAQINFADNCKNQTGMKVTQEDIPGNPNGTETETSPSSAASGSAASATPTGAAVQAKAFSGKGTPRRKVKKVHRAAGTDDKKLQTALKKLNVQPIQAIEEVNMFKSDGNVIHFSAPKVHASVPANTFAIYGHGEDKELTELVPGILNQLGPDSLASLRKLAESYQSMQKEKGEDGDKKEDDDEEDDDDIPDLVAGDNFESKTEVE
ncbi:uncharacterized protein J4E78_006171 [Alternaria triticimaculans]|uniref:uncharacterized protein n=1 Tax=Alternaria triticimaculans TaxID=297637 RepID=UPI0020C27FA0|nr:uncharacterized protein J4E78_006171 [Alternaria triticimaculans]KAI4657782.1 hypothetical protein J4E78_006171 [Alternaria triticimaculans]